ncbi:MAG: hypothetical protein K2L87_06270, partial [Clostridiales bacterium]|nr:hypothetical protein [Clostridiales bacterium]
PYIVGHEADKANTVKTIAFADADHTISIADVPDGYVAIGAQTGLTQRSYENGVITFEAPTAGTFTITVTPKPANDWMWETGNSDTIQFTFAIGDARIATPVYEGGTATTATAEYDAKWHEVKIAVDSNGLVQYTVTCDTTGQMDGAYAVQEVSWEYNVLTLRFINYGVYTITFSHINSENSKWANLSGDAAKNARSLTYSITRKHFTAPNLEGKAVTVTSESVDYTGQKVQFTFENLPKLQDEVGNDLFTVTLSDGMSIVSWENGKLVVEAVNAKAYTVTLGNANSYNTRWEVVGSSTSRPASRAYSLSINRALYTTPNIQGKAVGTFTASAQYNGQYHEFVIENIPTTKDIDGNNLFTVLYNSAPIPTTGTGGLELVSWENNTLTVRAVNYGSYAIVLGQTNTDNTRWAAYGNTSAGNGRTFTFSITMGYYNQPVIVGAASGAINYSTQYTGSYQTFVMTGVPNTLDVFGDPMFTVDNMPEGMTVVSWENDTLTLSARIATSYAITVRNAHDGTNSRWIRPDSTSTPTARTYTITITNKYINFPVVQGTKDNETQRVTYTYNTQYQKLIITGVINDKDMDGNTFIIVDQSTLPEGLEFVSWENDTLILQAKNAGTYAFSLKLADPASVRWYRQSNSTTYTTDRTYTIVINKAGVPTPNRSVTSVRYNYNGQKQQFSIRNVEKGLISYKYGTFPMEEASWTSATDSDPNVLTVQASDIGAYTILISLAEPNNYYWIGRTSYISTYTYSYSVTINKYQQTYPKYKDTTSLNKSVVYNGGYQEFTFVNVFKDWNKYTPSGMEEVSWDEDGTLVLRAKNVGTYSPKIELIDPLNGKYINTSGYTYGTERQFTINITPKSFVTTINFVSSNSDIQAQINANNLQWPAGVDVAASITFDGVVEPDYPNIEVYYYQDSSVTYPLDRDEEDGLYHLPKKLSYGYWRVGVRTATDGSVNNYKQSKTTVTKQFLINTAFAPFSDSENNPKAPHEYLLWQYSNSKIAGGAKQLVEHNDDATLKYGTQENPR